MAEKSTIPLPIPTPEYDVNEQAFTRRMIEQSIEDLNQEIGTLKTMQQSGASKALKRHIFLIMGTKGG